MDGRRPDLRARFELTGMPNQLPVIDMTSLFGSDPVSRSATAKAIDAACRDYGFFYLVGHDIEPAAFTAIESAARDFFAFRSQRKPRSRWQMAAGLGAAGFRSMAS